MIIAFWHFCHLGVDNREGHLLHQFWRQEEFESPSPILFKRRRQSTVSSIFYLIIHKLQATDTTDLTLTLAIQYHIIIITVHPQHD